MCVHQSVAGVGQGTVFLEFCWLCRDGMSLDGAAAAAAAAVIVALG